MRTAGVIVGVLALAGCSEGAKQPEVVEPVAVEAATETPVVEAKAEPAVAGAELPPGSEMVGQQASEWEALAWANSEPLTLEQLRGRVVVVRFWTNTCPYCRASMPALQRLSEEFNDQPVTFVGMYHAKPRDRPGAWADAQALAREWGVTFALGHDAGWKTLRSWWLRDGQRRATSASFVIDPDGKIVHVHPGPVLFPSDDPEHAKEDADFQALRQAVLDALPSGGT